MNKEKAKKISVATSLHGGGAVLPPDMIGAKIVNIGQPTGEVGELREIEGGGLVIDYIPMGEKVSKRIVFAFNDLGMWIEFSGAMARLD